MGGLLDLAGEGLGHLGSCGGLGFMVPQLLLVGAGHVWNDELYILLYQLTLLPGDRLTLVSSRPDLLAILISLPECDTVLFGHVPTLGEMLLVRNCLLALVTRLLHKQLGGKLLLCVLLRLHSHFTFFIWHNLSTKWIKIHTLN